MRLFTMFLCLPSLLTMSAFADPPPPTVNVQGALTTVSGDPVVGTRFYRVRFFDSESDGTQLGEDLAGVTVVSPGGIFNFDIALPTEVLTVPASWYELAVDTSEPSDHIDEGDVFADRFKVNSVPFALLAANSGLLSGSAASDFTTLAQVGNQFLRRDLSDEFSGAKLTVDGALDVGKEGVGSHDVNIFGASSGGRLHWSESRSALRAGRDTVGQWDVENIGLYSVALGYNTTASGISSTAMGQYGTAGGFASTAMGYQTTASGSRSTSMGLRTTASGSNSLAMGRQTTASGDESISAGFYSIASGVGSTAMGRSTTASGVYSTATGLLSEASGNNSTAMGNGTTANGQHSTAMGHSTTAGGYASTAMGYRTTASGSSSTAMGYRTTASGRYSTAMGFGPTASGKSSTAAGFYSTASGQESVAIGRYTIASGTTSVAMGRGIEAAGAFSVAIALDDQIETVVANDNTMAIMGGDVGIGSVAPSTRLRVEDNAAGFVVSVVNEGNSADRDGILVQAGSDDGSGKTVFLLAADGDGDRLGALQWDGMTFSAITASDVKTKTDIRDTEVEALAIVEALRVVDYKRKATPDGPTIRGFIAQEAREVYPEMVTQLDEDLLGISKDALIPILTKALQEQGKTISELKEELSRLREMIESR